MRKRALLIVGLALLVAAAGVVYAHWTDTLVMNVNVNTGTIDPQWSLAGTNDDGINDGWDGEPVLSTVYTYDGPDPDGVTSRDPSAAASVGDILRIDRTQPGVANTGAFGWSCPPDHPYAVGGGITSAPGPVNWVLAVPGATLGGYTYPVFAHYTYGTGETGFAAINGGTGGTVEFWLECSDVSPTPRYDKDVADCFATGNGADTLTVSILNGYPSYWCTVKADLHNDGTVPVKLQSISVTGLNPDVLDVVMPSFTCGYQLDPGAMLNFLGSFHAKNPVVQNAFYQISYTLNWVNYNEFIQGSCSGF